MAVRSTHLPVEIVVPRLRGRVEHAGGDLGARFDQFLDRLLLERRAAGQLVELGDLQVGE